MGSIWNQTAYVTPGNPFFFSSSVRHLACSTFGYPAVAQGGPRRAASQLRVTQELPEPRQNTHYNILIVLRPNWRIDRQTHVDRGTLRFAATHLDSLHDSRRYGRRRREIFDQV